MHQPKRSVIKDDLDFHNASILIVDDQDANVQLLKQLLHTEGYQNITTTMDPHAVCALHRDKHYDLILLDLLMPKMDGFEVMEELKKLKIDDYLPVLVLTAQPSHKLRALQAGAKDFISQPFNLIEVKTRIRNMLEVRLLYKKAKHYGLEMRSLALHDGLTGLPNRQLFMDRLSLAIANAHRYKRNMTCIWI